MEKMNGFWNFLSILMNQYLSMKCTLVDWLCSCDDNRFVLFDLEHSIDNLHPCELDETFASPYMCLLQIKCNNNIISILAQWNHWVDTYKSLVDHISFSGRAYLHLDNYSIDDSAFDRNIEHVVWCNRYMSTVKILKDSIQINICRYRNGQSLSTCLHGPIFHSHSVVVSQWRVAIGLGWFLHINSFTLVPPTMHLTSRVEYPLPQPTEH